MGVKLIPESWETYKHIFVYHGSNSCFIYRLLLKSYKYIIEKVWFIINMITFIQ